MSTNELNHNKNGNVALEEVENTKAIKNAASSTAASKAEPTADVAAAAAALTSPSADYNKKTPVKRTPSKRMSFIERAQKESEELVRTMGGNLQMEGGRRTRSSMRGTPTSASTTVSVSPPPAKKARNEPSHTTPSKGRGRRRKSDTTKKTPELADNIEETDHKQSDKPAVKARAEKTPVKGKSKKHVESITEEKLSNNNDVAKATAELSESTATVDKDQTDSTKAVENTHEIETAKEEAVVKNNVDHIEQPNDDKKDAEMPPIETENKAQDVEHATETKTEQDNKQKPAEAMDVDDDEDDDADAVEEKTSLVEEQCEEQQNDKCQNTVPDIKQAEIATNNDIVADDTKITETTENAADVPVANTETILSSASAIETTNTISEKISAINVQDAAETQSNINNNNNNGALEEETNLESTNNVSNKKNETTTFGDDIIKVQKEQSEEIKHAPTTNEALVVMTTAADGGA